MKFWVLKLINISSYQAKPLYWIIVNIDSITELSFPNFIWCVSEGVLLVPQFAGALASNIGGTFGKLMGSIFSSAITTGGITVLIMTALMGEKVED